MSVNSLFLEGYRILEKGVQDTVWDLVPSLEPGKVF